MVLASLENEDRVHFREGISQGYSRTARRKLTCTLSVACATLRVQPIPKRRGTDLIPVKNNITEIDNMQTLDEVDFSISAKNSAWVMRAVADLYSNRELAVIREYSTNAYDSNKERAIADGTDIAPIKVSLPNAMNPYFTVQDFGVGMSEAELKEVYTQFGESTKRESDDFNGMLGFGSKSAIAYTNTFTITSVKNGHKTVAAVVRREDAMGGYHVTMKILVSNPTSEGNGVTIQVPVHNWREFEQKARDFYRYWLPGTVLVNGREPEWAVGDKIADNLYMHASQGTSYVVMGNVAYRIANPDALFPKGMNRISFVAYVDNGAVEFTPSREDLKYSDHTKTALHKIIGDFVNTAVETAKKEIAAATTHYDAYRAWDKWRNIVGASQVEDLTFKGDKLVDQFAINAMRYDSHSTRYNTYAVNSWHVADSGNTLFVTDFAHELSSSQKAKVRQYLAMTNTVTARWVLFTANDVKNPWVDPSRVIKWEDLKAAVPKKPSKPRVKNVAWGRKAGTFDIVSKAGRKDEQDVPQSKELYFIMVQEYNAARDSGSYLENVLNEFNLDHEVVIMPANRKDKFLRFYPHAQPIMPLLKAKVNFNGPSLISADGMERLGLDRNEVQILAGMDEAKIDDPEIVRLIQICKIPQEKYLEDYSRQYRLASLLGLSNQFQKHKYTNYWDARNAPLSKSYPLAPSWRPNRNTIQAQIYLYMNAVYAARKAGKNV